MNLFGVSLTDANTGQAAGWNGTILHTTNGGVTFAEPRRTSEVPSQFSLEQNHPTPFNPTTIIAYVLGYRSSVKLVVYDLLGREVATLVNEQKSPGTYAAIWDASGVASGVYFYRSQASTTSRETGGFISVKKMLALK